MLKFSMSIGLLRSLLYADYYSAIPLIRSPSYTILFYGTLRYHFIVLFTVVTDGLTLVPRRETCYTLKE